MSDHMMSVEEARGCLEVLDVVLMPREVQKIAARTIVAQAEQIERLQTAVGEAVSTSGDGVDDLIAEGILLPGDMEAPEVKG